MLEKYEQFVLEQLGIPAPVLPASGELIQGLFLPSFDPEVCISVVLPGEGEAALSVGAFASNCWYERSSGKRAPKVWRASAVLPEETWLMLQLELDALPRTELVDVPLSGTDGIFLLGRRWSHEGNTLQFRAWSPETHSTVHKFFSLLFLAAQEAISDAMVQLLMEPLYCYLDLGLPLRDLGGTPRVVRVFGSLSSQDREPLEVALFGIPDDVELFVDISQLRSMGASLIPLFQKLNKRPGQTTFITSTQIRSQLNKAGLKMIWPGEFPENKGSRH